MNFGGLHGRGRPVHLHDVFHYYIGSKYFAELNYTHIYRCAAVWDVQRGRGAALVLFSVSVLWRVELLRKPQEEREEIEMRRERLRRHGNGS